jgi:hypothetical protein
MVDGAQATVKDRERYITYMEREDRNEPFSGPLVGHWDDARKWVRRDRTNGGQFVS